MGKYRTLTVKRPAPNAECKIVLGKKGKAAGRTATAALRDSENAAG